MKNINKVVREKFSNISTSGAFVIASLYPEKKFNVKIINNKFKISLHMSFFVTTEGNDPMDLLGFKYEHNRI